jgi:hypothetical protein
LRSIARRRRIEKPGDAGGMGDVGVRDLKEERCSDRINYHGGGQAVFRINTGSSVVHQVFMDIVLRVVGVIGGKGAFHSWIVVHVIVCVDVARICRVVRVRCVGISVRVVGEVRMF